MAITLLKEPNQYNLAYVPNVYTLTGLNAEDKYAIGVEVNGNIVATFQQPSNLNGVAHFDISKVLQSYLEPTFVETTQFATATPGESLTYRVLYGSTTDGIPAWDGFSLFKTVINGYDSWRVLNWDDSAYNPSATLEACESIGDGTRWSSANYLTNYPKSSYPLRSNSYHTLSFFNRMENWENEEGVAILWPGTTAQPAFGVIKFYSPTGSLIQTSIFSLDESNGGLGPRQNYNSTSLSNWEDKYIIGTIAAGPQNLKDAGLWPTNGIPAQIWGQITQTFGSNTNIWNLGASTSVIAYYDVEIYSLDQCYWNFNGAPANEDATTLQNYLGDLIYTHRFTIEDPCSAFDAVTVSFVNQYGVKDYFTFDRRNTRSLSINRNNYNQTVGSWTEYEFTIDQHGRGRRTFSTDITEEMTLSTYWMGDDESKWLEELFVSPNIQVYVDGQWEPAVISSNVYEQKTYARDRMFQHTLTVTFSNDKKVQRG
jgi:hypothetical protein